MTVSSESRKKRIVTTGCECVCVDGGCAGTYYMCGVWVGADVGIQRCLMCVFIYTKTSIIIIAI